MPWADRASLRQAYGLDEPMWKQFVLFHKNVITGEFGKSFRPAATSRGIYRSPHTSRKEAVSMWTVSDRRGCMKAQVL
jgi:hypothetical protein